MAGFNFDLMEDRRLQLGWSCSTDETIENEFRQIIPGQCDLYHSRIPSQPEVTAETLMQMKADLPDAAAAIPASFGMDVIGYACTSGATIIGPEEVAARIRQRIRRPSDHTGDSRCFSLSSPELPTYRFCNPIFLMLICIRDFLEQNGLTIANLVSFEQSSEAVVANITPSVLAAFMKPIMMILTGCSCPV